MKIKIIDKGIISHELNSKFDTLDKEEMRKVNGGGCWYNCNSECLCNGTGSCNELSDCMCEVVNSTGTHDCTGNFCPTFLCFTDK